MRLVPLSGRDCFSSLYSLPQEGTVGSQKSAARNDCACTLILVSASRIVRNTVLLFIRHLVYDISLQLSKLRHGPLTTFSWCYWSYHHIMLHLMGSILSEFLSRLGTKAVLGTDPAEKLAFKAQCPLCLFYHADSLH